MHYVTDLHLHSRYSRAVSPQMNLTVMSQYAREKGIDILTAADFTHPLWFKEIASEFEEREQGLYELRVENGELRNKRKTKFLLTTEIASICKHRGKLRRIHNLIFVPNLATAEKVTKELVKRGCNLNADGRPIIGLPSEDLLNLILTVDERCLLIPCHIWTPHFGVYGSASGYDSLEEAFGKLAPYVYGIETGISSDPGMNWQVPELKNRSILSFSDAHSAPKMAREATVLELESLSYENIRKAIMYQSTKSNPANKIAYTLEFYPEEGKYHFSGHRNCKVSVGPDEIRAGGTICRVCQRRMTEGVLYRVQELSDDGLSVQVEEAVDEYGVLWFRDATKQHPPFVKLVPLLEICAESLKSTVNSQKSKNLFIKLCTEVGSELDILLRTPIATIETIGGMKVAQGIEKVRAGKIEIEPGYDGEYGKVSIWKERELKQMQDVPQLKLDI